MVRDPSSNPFCGWLVCGFLRAPTDAQQGAAYRIIFIHVPAAWWECFFTFLLAIMQLSVGP